MSITEPHDDRDPGKFDDEARALLMKVGAAGVLVIVIGGERGSGFSFAAINPSATELVPPVLRKVADEIEGGARA